MANYYCEYCGQKYASVSTLTHISCPNHPAGATKGKHKLYEGSEKSKYTCKYCGTQYSTLPQLTHSRCRQHPTAPHNGRHAPAL